MNRNDTLQQMLILLMGMLTVLACNGGAIAATLTPVPTNTYTPLPTSTSTPKPTSTPRPTATLEPTPAAVGVPVRNARYEVTVLRARRLDGGVYTGDGYYRKANPGYVFVELGVRVRNLQPGSTAAVPWNDVYVVEDSGAAWYPNWAGFVAVESGKETDPASIKVTQEAGADLVAFSDDAYLRVIYIVTEKDPTKILFGFDDSPMIEVVLPK